MAASKRIHCTPLLHALLPTHAQGVNIHTHIQPTIAADSSGGEDVCTYKSRDGHNCTSSIMHVCVVLFAHSLKQGRVLVVLWSIFNRVGFKQRERVSVVTCCSSVYYKTQ